MELFHDKKKWQEVKEFYIAQAELKQFLNELKSGKVPVLLPIDEKQKNKQHLNEPNQSEAIQLISELNKHLMGKEFGPSPNGVEKGVS